ncbi:MAG: RNA-guided pseudouridylation complex pseudouridine synthase subunit Cbf5 [Nitrososphaerales archaeon]
MSATQPDTSSRSASKEEELLVIDVEETGNEYGRYPERRTVEELLDYGFIPLDKPAGPTSHEVVSWVRKMLKIDKAGHSGTLDPAVTGLLPIGLGEATKALSVLLLGPKEYYGLARLHSPVDDAKLKRVFREFTGEIYQKPPQKSSVKRLTRRRWIYELEIVEQKGRLILFRVLCQAGTYVRKLIYDIGEALGPGATMVELRRSRVSNLGEKDGLVRLHDLADAVYEWRENGSEEKIRRLIQPVEDMVSSLKKMVIRDSAVSAICHGAQLAAPGVLKLSPDIAKGETVAIYTLKGELVAIGEASMTAREIEDSEKGLVAETRRVIMKQDTYPRLWKPKKSSDAGVA